MITGILIGVVSTIIIMYLLTLLPDKRISDHKSFEEKMMRYWQKSIENQANHNESLQELNETLQDIALSVRPRLS